MSSEALDAATRAMRAEGVSEVAIRVFSDFHRQLQANVTGTIPEATVEPLREVPRIDDEPPGEDAVREALAATVVVKLNGGLGTSMGVQGPKSALEVREGRSSSPPSPAFAFAHADAAVAGWEPEGAGLFRALRAGLLEPQPALAERPVPALLPLPSTATETVDRYGQLPEEVRTDLATWAGCVAGAALVDDLRRTLEAVGFRDISDAGFWSMMVFLAVLTIGFAYEWKKGALEWD